MESYLERRPVPGLAGAVRTVWIQRTGAAAYVQRHLPTGGVEIHVPIGGSPQMVGPLTGPLVEIIPARTTIVGVRFRPENPAWYHNLLAHPDVTVELGTETIPVHATEIEGAERDDVYARNAERRPQFAEYQAKVERRIPVIELVRR